MNCSWKILLYGLDVTVCTLATINNMPPALVIQPHFFIDKNRVTFSEEQFLRFTSSSELSIFSPPLFIKSSWRRFYLYQLHDVDFYTNLISCGYQPPHAVISACNSVARLSVVSSKALRITAPACGHFWILVRQNVTHHYVFPYFREEISTIAILLALQ
jgi:hypothetical protein